MPGQAGHDGKRPGMTEGSGRDLTTTTLKQMPGQAGHDGTKAGHDGKGQA